MLEVRNIVSGYGKIEVLHGVSSSVQEGLVTALIGPNGAGKSTLLKTIFGYLKPREGEILFEGESLVGLRPDQILRKGIVYIPQGRSIFPEFSILENLKIAAYAIKDRKKTDQGLATVFDMFPILKERQKQRASKLSGGEQTMLEFGRILILEPKLILLDEPSLGLAPKIIDKTYGHIKTLTNRGLTFLIVEQNVRKILEIAHYTYVLDLGRNKFDGKSEDLKKSPELRKLYLGG